MAYAYSQHSAISDRFSLTDIHHLQARKIAQITTIKPPKKRSIRKQKIIINTNLKKKILTPMQKKYLSRESKKPNKFEKKRKKNLKWLAAPLQKYTK